MPLPLPPFAHLHSRLSYNPDTGDLFWRAWEGHSKQFNGRYAGTKAASYSGRYSLVQLDRRRFHTHRIIWKMMTANDPSNDIDHIDGNPHNNRWINLRVVTRAQNTWNARMPRTNTSGYRGVSFFPPCSTWRARIWVAGKNKTLGYFFTPEEASKAYEAAFEKYRGRAFRFHSTTRPAEAP